MAKFKRLTTGALGALGAAALLSGSAQAQNVGQELIDAVMGGKVDLTLRTRFEHVDDDALAPGGGKVKDANAFTLRSVLGYETGRFYGFGAYASAVDVSAFGGKAYNSTVNGKTDRAVVADPETTEVSQVYVSYQVPTGAYGADPNNYLTGTNLRYGRQQITFQNHRWIGNVVWRQKFQMYDGARLNYDSKRFGVNFNYAYIYNVNQIFTERSGNRADWRMNSHLLNLDLDLGHWTPVPAHLIGYALLFDYNNGAPVGRSVPVGSSLAGQSSSRASNKTFGVRLDGKYPFAPERGPQALTLVYTGEYAHQSDYANGAGVIDADYIFGQLGFEWVGVHLSGAYELLGGDGDYALQTPFATLHGHNGWADQFLTTPAQGLQDVWVQAGYTTTAAVSSLPDMWRQILGNIKLLARYHDFNSDKGSIHYGREFDIQAVKQVTPQLSILLKYANYWADGDNTPANQLASNITQDTQKWWLQGQFTF